MGSASFDPQVAEQAKHSIVTFGRRLVVDRLAVGTAGNLSVRVGDVVAISPSRLSYGAIESQDICLVDFAGPKIEGRRGGFFGMADAFEHLPVHQRSSDRSHALT